LPIGKKLPRYKVIRCNATKERHLITRIDRDKYPRRHVPVDVIFKAIRRHYKKYHPVLFKRMIRKAQYTKRKRK
jgi:hypothetical protein